MHFVTAGSSAAVLFLLLDRVEVTPGGTVNKALPARSIVVVTFTFGVTVAVLWEFLEWAGNAFISESIHVGYIDTLIDIAAGGAGAILAGILLARWKDLGDPALGEAMSASRPDGSPNVWTTA